MSFALRKVKRKYAQDTIRELEHRIRSLALSNETLKEEFNRNERDMDGSVERIQEEISGKNRMLLSHRKDLQDIGNEKELKRRLKEYHASWSKKFQDRQSYWNKETKVVEGKIERARDELQLLQDFIHHRDDHQKKIKILEEEFQNIDADNDMKIKALQKRFDDELIEMDREYARQVEKIETESFKQIEKNLDFQTQSIVDENVKRKEHVEMRKEQIEKLEQFISEKRNLVSDLKQRLEDLHAKETETLTSTHKTKSYIKSKAKIRKEVENEQKRLKETFASEEEDIQISHNEEMKGLERDIKTRRVLCERHIKEIHDIREILEDVLMNMSTAQLDFVEILHTFRKKKQIRQEEREVEKLAVINSRKALAKHQKQVQFPSIAADEKDIRRRRRHHLGKKKKKLAVVFDAVGSSRNNREKRCGVETWDDMETVLNMYMKKLRRHLPPEEDEKQGGGVYDEDEDRCDGVFVT